jgi:hypothetical protein
MAMDVSGIAKLTEAVDAVRTFAEKAEGQGGAGSAVPTGSSAVRLAHDARQSYQKTARWMLAAFATVGVLIFGSLPFAAIADVELTWPASLWLVGGLVLAVAGIVSAVVAVSLVNEPEDASLGELDCDLRSVQEVDEKGFVSRDGKPVITVGGLRVRWNPRLAARVELANILHGPEADAHLGPNLAIDDRQASVANLIARLGDLESRHAELAPLVAKRTVSVEAHEKRVAELSALLTELRTRRSELAPEADTATVDKEIGAASSMSAAVAAKLDSERAALTRDQQDLAEVDHRLSLYHDHRDLVLAESGVMQLRGTFRLARRVLAVAAMLTLFGGTGYALALPGATTGDEPAAATPAPAPRPAPAPPFTTGLPATVTIHEGTAAAAELPGDCVGRELTATWVADSRVPDTTGPFTALLTDPACTGEVTVARGEGRFTLTR